MQLHVKNIRNDCLYHIICFSRHANYAIFELKKGDNFSEVVSLESTVSLDSHNTKSNGLFWQAIFNEWKTLIYDFSMSVTDSIKFDGG